MKKNTLNWFAVCFAFLSLLVSCSTDGCDDKFLFINVDAEYTGAGCLWFLVFQGIAIYYSKFYRKKSGIISEEIQNNIYDSRGNRIGSYDTGKYRSWFVSEEEAENGTAKVRFWAWIARIALPRAFVTACVVSWVFTSHPVWEVVLWLAIAPIWIYKRIENGLDTQDTKLLLEILYIIVII